MLLIYLFIGRIIHFLMMSVEDFVNILQLKALPFLQQRV
jgi:hypothetical protein